MVVFILIALWAIVLAPPLLRAKNERSGDSIGEFNYRLGVLGRAHDTGPTPLIAPSVGSPFLRPAASSRPGGALRGAPRLTAAQRSAKRRRDIVTGLCAAAGLTFVFAAVSGGSIMWGLQVFCDLLLATYLALVYYFRSLQAERLEKVRYLPSRPAPQFALRRSASS